MPDTLARDVARPDDPTPVFVHVTDGDVLIRRLTRVGEDRPLAVDIDDYWRRIGTVGRATVLRDGLSVPIWRAVPDAGDDTVVGTNRKSTVLGMLAMLGMEAVDANSTSQALFDV